MKLTLHVGRYGIRFSPSHLVPFAATLGYGVQQFVAGLRRIGVGKGIKWLSNLNMGLSIFLLAFFLLFGSTAFGLSALFNAAGDDSPKARSHILFWATPWLL